jgi:pyruvate dehydrogenase E2 component (dihydrolipoamide acetyltransferase)
MRHVILLPDLGQTTSEAKVLSWWKRPGEKVLRGEPLLAVETDKVDMDVESFVEGYLRESLVEAGAVATALQPVAILTDTPEENYDAPAGRIAAAPAAKSLARELGVALDALSGTGPNGLIVRRDVRQFAASHQPVESRAISGMAAIVSASKRDIPHFYASLDVDTASAEAWRAKWNSSHPGLRASINDIFVRCSAMALRDVPRLNTRLQDGAYRQSPTCGILMVVARDSSLALVEAPNPLAGDWEQFLRGMRASAAGSQPSRPLLALSNLGMFGLKQFTAIIPPGCNAVLAIGAIREAPVVRGGRLEVGRICTLTLSADHRVVDGIAAARFLEKLQHYLNSL